VSRRQVAVALVAYSVFLGVVLFAPSSGTQSEGASWLGDLATWLGVPDRIVSQGRVEFVGNALILMPVSALGSLLWPSTNWRDWTAYAFAIACVVELVQGLTLSHRTATFTDIVANALGGLGGAVVVLVLRRLGVPLGVSDDRPHG
jgi:hypothetical protein